MQTRHTQEREDAFQLSEDDLRSIVQLLQDHYSMPERRAPIIYFVQCVDGSEFTLGSVDEVLQLENTNYRRIQTVKIDVPVSPNVACTVRFSSTTSKTVVISIYDDDDKRALKIRHELNNRLNESKLWYSILTRNRFSLTFIPVIVTALALSAFPSQATKMGLNPSILWVPLLMLIFLLIFVSTGLEKSFTWLFPPMGFAWGRQVAVLEHRAKWRRALGGLIGAVLIGCLTKPIW